MGKINDIFRQHAQSYISANPERITEQQRNTINAIVKCRTGELGHAVYQCPDCQHRHCVERSCGNRHCTACQGKKTSDWLKRQLDRRLPCSYFMLTFTVPEEMRTFIRLNPQTAYSAMFEAAAYAIKKLSKDERHIGCDIAGFCAVLHTWGRQLQFHPHIHVIIPAGGIDAQCSQWMPSDEDFFLPVRALSKIFRGRFKEKINQKPGSRDIQQNVWRQSWNVHCEAVGSGEQALKYLARYVFRVAISDERILAVTNSHVVVSYKKAGSRRQRKLRLTIAEFIRRFLQHILPNGFMKIRYYGFMSSNSKIDIDEIRELIKEANDMIKDAPDIEFSESPTLRCPNCNLPLRYLGGIIYAGESTISKINNRATG